MQHIFTIVFKLCKCKNLTSIVNKNTRHFDKNLTVGKFHSPSGKLLWKNLNWKLLMCIKVVFPIYRFVETWIDFSCENQQRIGLFLKFAIFHAAFVNNVVYMYSLYLYKYKYYKVIVTDLLVCRSQEVNVPQVDSFSCINNILLRCILTTQT